MLYAPGLADLETVRTICSSVTKPVNVLAVPGFTVSNLAEAGAKRISLGSKLTTFAYGMLQRLRVSCWKRARSISPAKACPLQSFRACFPCSRRTDRQSCGRKMAGDKTCLPRQEDWRGMDKLDGHRHAHWRRAAADRHRRLSADPERRHSREACLCPRQSRPSIARS